eukprot:5409545-Pyramimonas_sp.AAC.1
MSVKFPRQGWSAALNLPPNFLRRRAVQTLVLRRRIVPNQFNMLALFAGLGLGARRALHAKNAPAPVASRL